MAPNNMYRVGDYVYVGGNKDFDKSFIIFVLFLYFYSYVDAGSHNPFGVRRIDELTKSACGNVEVKTTRVFFHC